jgi:hypothetical protein
LERLRQKLAERGLLDDSQAQAAQLCAQADMRLSAQDVEGICARMKAAMQQGDAEGAARLFDPLHIQHVCCAPHRPLLVHKMPTTRGLGDDKQIDGRTDCCDECRKSYDTV